MQICNVVLVRFSRLIVLLVLHAPLQVVADAAMNIASNLDRRATAYIDALWIAKKAEEKLEDKVWQCRPATQFELCSSALIIR